MSSEPRLPRLPTSTYRLQLHTGFTLDDAAAIVPYLHALGVGDVYLSPLFRARPGSTHGYDVTDPTHVNPELGGEPALARAAAALAERGMGLLIDIVPNHMAASTHNPWWRDVLQHGRSSEHARVFDIQWDALAPVGDGGRVLLPLLGAPFGDVLAADELAAAAAPDGPVVRYYEHELPLDPATWTGPPRSPQELAALLDRQHYRLAHWPLASELANYRRFFDISDLVGVRVEDERVFAATHELVLRLARAGLITGVRVDHVDGLRDPTGYLDTLQAALAGDGVFAVWVEKILAGDEALPASWPVAGATGYEVAGEIDRALVDARGLDTLATAYRHITGRDEGFAQTAVEQKRRLLDLLFAGELRSLAARLVRLARGDLRARDLSPSVLTEALAQISAGLPVYRSYSRDGEPDAAGREHLRASAASAAQRLPASAAPALDFVRRVLGLEWRGGEAGEHEELVARWQQLTGPLAAKGVEDTALYRWNALVALNEVGGEPQPSEEDLGVEAFHERMLRRHEQHPGALNAGTTHDTKRSEDVRARLLVLSEMAGAWVRTVEAWHEENAGRRRVVDGSPAPDVGEELLVYQTLVGVWPLDERELEELPDRLAGYLRKALREAKEHSSWLAPDEAYEAAVIAFACGLAAEHPDGRFMQRFLPLQRRVAIAGAVGSLAAALLRLTAPGIPDIYQGSELWNLSLTDPDNRRPVDFDLRRRLLAEVDGGAGEDRRTLCAEVVREWRDGRIKLLLTASALRLRREQPTLVSEGGYLPLRASGAHGRNVLAYARRAGEAWLLAVAPRLSAGLALDGAIPLGERWNARLHLPEGAPQCWRDIVSGAAVRAEGGSLPLADVFRRLPVGLLLPA